MKRAIVCLLFVLFVAATGWAQGQSTVIIKGSEVVTGVVIISGQPAMTAGQPLTEPATKRGSFELQCNKGVPSCVAPPPGTYVLVRLPKNYGMYDCVNAHLYPNGADPETSHSIGDYCLIEH